MIAFCESDLRRATASWSGHRGIAQQLGDLNAQRIGDFEQHGETRVRLSGLDPTKAIDVDTGAFGQLLLRQLRGKSNAARVGCKRAQCAQKARRRHAETVSRAESLHKGHGLANLGETFFVFVTYY